ncbi:hypothetical protein KC19_2G084800 [Ceratodon purpureus]|uniref:glutathione transferase n=1 Tax=Ceratodon purpureus TaxID=3225 RepID=A0A8T0IRL0_CERPU|nr:hypothetical protein KC19_2G084800 [Ceratodon purpureus]
MGIVVLGSYLSPYSLRVLIELEELVVDYELKPVNIKQGEHRTPEFLKMQPFGQVPVLQDDDLTLFESRAITRYLAEKFDGQGTPLLGKSMKEKALVNQWVEVESQNYDRPLIAIVEQVVWKPSWGKTTNEEIVAAEMAKLEKVLDVYEAQLTKHKYLAGDFFSLADLGHLPGTHLLVNIGKKGAVFADRPHLNAWWEDISSRPSFKKTMAKTP